MWYLWTVLVILLWIYMDRNFLRHQGFEAIPGPKGTFLLENSLQLIMDPGPLYQLLSYYSKAGSVGKLTNQCCLFSPNYKSITVKLFYYFRSLSNQYKYLYKLKLGPKKVVIIHNPEDIEVVISGSKNISKGFFYRFIKPWLKEGLLLSDGAKWQQRRRILTPAFHFNVLKCFRPIFEENSLKLVEQLSLEVDKPETNITTCISDFTLNSICETAMGTTLDVGVSDHGSHYKESIHQLGQIVVHRAQRMWIYLNWVFSLSKLGKKQEQLLQELSTFRDSVINKRRKNSNNNFQNSIITGDIYDDDVVYGKKRLAMLDLLLEAEENGLIDARGIGEEVDTFMFEGHDTTATALQFAFMLLANNPKAQNLVMEEIDCIFDDSGRSVKRHDLGQMKYLECCIKESLRLYPPVAFIMRKIDEDLNLKYHEIPAGIDCAIVIYDLHRRNDQFVNPQEFYPERFLTEPTWHPYGYLPFSAGPRNCIGQKFAMMEMKVVLSAVLRHFRLLPVTKPHDVVFVTDLILRPNHPIYVKFERRT